MDAVYADRNNLVQLCALLAAKCGYQAGVRIPVEDSEWPVVTIKLPDVGEVAWHVKDTDLFLGVTTNVVYDGHTNEEKEQRIKNFIGAEQEKMARKAAGAIMHD